MPTLKPPLSISKQLERLKEHGVLVDGYTDRQISDILSRVNYYRLTGYTLQFRKDPRNSDCLDGTELKDILSLYRFDTELRNLLLRYLEPIEIKCRTVIAYRFSISHCRAPNYDQHLDLSSYYRKHDAREIIESFFKEEGYRDQPLFIEHHVQTYQGHAPLWVMVETMPFSRLSKYYNCLYKNDKESIAKLFGTSVNNLHNALQCLVRLRNQSAHGDRIYNTEYRLPARLTYTKVKNEVSARSVFAYLLVLCQYLPTLTLRKSFVGSFTELLEHYDSNIVRWDLLGIPENGLNLFNLYLSR